MIIIIIIIIIIMIIMIMMMMMIRRILTNINIKNNNKEVILTGSPRAQLSLMIRTQVTAIATQRLIRTIVHGFFNFCQKNSITEIVIRTASKETEQPTVEMISSAFSCSGAIYD